jgi:hypothetical protein
MNDINKRDLNNGCYIRRYAVQLSYNHGLYTVINRTKTDFYESYRTYKEAYTEYKKQKQENAKKGISIND